MTADEIEDLAFEGRELPEELTGSEALLFLMFRNLYDFARRTEMDREQGKREKGRILAKYRHYQAVEIELDKLHKHYANYWKRIESAAAEYTHSPSIETADKFFQAVYGVPRKERK